MPRVYKTVGSEGGTKQHVIQQAGVEEDNKQILCNIGIDPDRDEKQIWRTKEDMYYADEVCEICKKEIFDPVPHLKTYKEEVKSDEYSSDSNDDTEEQGILAKIFSAVPWI